MQEVEDALSLETHQAQRIGSLRGQLALVRSTYRQLRSQYLNGAVDYLDVLTALREEQELERSLIAADVDRILFRIALYRALAGGFETPRESAEPGATEVASAEGEATDAPE